MTVAHKIFTGIAQNRIPGVTCLFHIALNLRKGSQKTWFDIRIMLK